MLELVYVPAFVSNVRVIFGLTEFTRRKECCINGPVFEATIYELTSIYSYSILPCTPTVQFAPLSLAS